MAEPLAINGTGERLSHPERETKAERERRHRRMHRLLRLPETQLECRIEDAYNVLSYATEQAGALAALWRGTFAIKDHDQRQAAIEGAKTIWVEIERMFGEVEGELYRAEAASAKFRRMSRAVRNMRRIMERR